MREAPHTTGPRPDPPKRTVEYLEALLLEKEQCVMTLEAELEHIQIRLEKYADIITGKNLDPAHKVHSHSHGRESATT